MGHEPDRPESLPLWCSLVGRTGSNQPTLKDDKCLEKEERSLVARDFDLPSFPLAYLLVQECGKLRSKSCTIFIL